MFGFEGFAIFVIVVALFAVITLLLGVKTVPQGYGYTVERWGTPITTGTGANLSSMTLRQSDIIIQLWPYW